MPATRRAFVESPTGLEVNLRERPEVHDQAKARLQSGTKIEVIDSQGDWIHVRHGTEVGFVYGGFVRYEGENETIIPSGLLQEKMQGARVSEAQRSLNGAGFVLDVDSIYGPEMVAAVSEFQQDQGLPVDGKIGPLTTKALSSATGTRRALIIHNFDYASPDIPNLSGTYETRELQQVLSDPNIGGFEVEVLENSSSEQLHGTLQEFLANAHLNDLVMVFISGLAVQSEEDTEVYFLSVDAQPDDAGGGLLRHDELVYALKKCDARNRFMVSDYAYLLPSLAHPLATKRLAPAGPIVGFGNFCEVLNHHEDKPYELNAGLTNSIIQGLKNGVVAPDHEFVTMRDLTDYLVDQSSEGLAPSISSNYNYQGQKRWIARNPAWNSDTRNSVSQATNFSPVSIWVTVGKEGKSPDESLSELKVGQSINWQVPSRVKTGDFVLMWITKGTGFRYLMSALKDAEVLDQGKTKINQKHFTELRVNTVFYEPIRMKDLRSAPVLSEWSLVNSNMQGAISQQSESLKTQPDLWEALSAKILEKNPGAKSAFDEIDASAGTEIKKASREIARVALRRDDAELEHDALGRAPLAVSLAWTLHEVWCTEQGLAPFPKRAPQTDVAGFVAQIDAPWGGGKTSFANLVACTLNPSFQDRPPEFLKTLYPDRSEMHGLFISACHETGKLKDPNSDDYLWERSARHPWVIVQFNAWRKQHIDPPWWSFYQTIRKTCFATIWKEGVPTVEQSVNGNYQCDREHWFKRVTRTCGLWSRELFWRIFAPQVVFRLLVALMAVLVAFLLVKTGATEASDGKAVWSTSSDIGVVLAVLTGTGAFLSAIFTVAAEALAPGRNTLSERVMLGAVDPLVRFRKHYQRMINAIERPILVVIDDIDRCEPKFIVEMIRGLQTILTSSRVVYLLLGDRNWIEQAFEIYHEDMKNIDVGPEHSFGGRFVEKAIQLPFILPSIERFKDDYVREVLMGRDSNRVSESADSELEITSKQEEHFGYANIKVGSSQKAGAAETNYDDFRGNPAEHRKRIRKHFSEASSIQEIDAAGAEALSVNSPASSESSAASRVHQRTVREEVVLRRAAQKEEVESAIRHALQPLAKFLPENPRHIKRIINAISMYQNSILLVEDDYSDAEFGGLRWRQLAVGVVLMIGYPKSWACLAANPEWANSLAERQDKPGNVHEDDTNALATYRVLLANTAFIDLLTKAKLQSKSGGEPVETRITKDVVVWLNQLFPVVVE